MKVFTSSCKLIEISTEVGQGGEGTVYCIENDQQLVAKIYHKPIASTKAEKLSAMAKMQNEELARVSAWPIDTLHDKPNGKIIGLIMPKLSGFKDIHKLYGPKSRYTEFPDVGWNFIVHTAINLATAFAVVHKYGHVVGDINHSNIVLSNQALVKFIDCDSFQISQSGNIFYCNVGVSTHQPPEFQTLTNFKDILRTSNHDNFGLAVLIFQLLFMGRHPYAGIYLGPGEMPLEKAIKEFRFAYGNSALLKQMKQPPNSLPLNAVTEPVADLFVKAFSANGISKRPSPSEWIVSLQKLRDNLKKCNRNEKHFFLNSLSECPWCSFEKNGTVFFSISKATFIFDNSSFDLNRIWTQINKITFPDSPSFPSPKFKAPRQEVVVYSKRMKFIKKIYIISLALDVYVWYKYGFFFALLTFLGKLTFYSKVDAMLGNIKKEVKAEYSSIAGDLEKLKMWLRETSDVEFRKKFTDLQIAKTTYLRLPELRKEKLNKLKEHQRQSQLETYLDRFDISLAQISGIGPARTATLQSFGIQTAADISYSKVIQIQGFGDVYASNLVSWRSSLEYKFVYNPKLPIDTTKVERECLMEKQRLETILLSGSNDLNQIVQKINSRRQFLLNEINKFYDKNAQIIADNKVISAL